MQQDERVDLTLRVIAFTIVVPTTGAILAPWWILSRWGPLPPQQAWPALVLVGIGAALYLYCLWLFAVVGRGTPGPWDPPRRFVAVGPYRWARNPIYIAALLVFFGEAWLFLSLPLLLYALVAAVAFHLFVILYEEPTLRRTFGAGYEDYVRTVPRWIPRPPRRA